MAKNRNYDCKDVEMATASRTIAQSFYDNITELLPLRTNWTPEYSTGLLNRIDGVFDTHLGVDSKKEQRMATANLIAVQVPAQRDLSFFKIQLEADFKDNPARLKEILKILGFTDNLKAVQKSNQQALVKLLYAFKSNMSETLKNEIAAKGINPVLIDNISGYAATVSNANVTQESLKETTKEITKEVADVFNGIYDEIIGICKIASNYYRYEPLKKEQFTFSNVLNKMKAAGKSAGVNKETKDTVA